MKYLIALLALTLPAMASAYCPGKYSDPSAYYQCQQLEQMKKAERQRSWDAQRARQQAEAQQRRNAFDKSISDMIEEGERMEQQREIDRLKRDRWNREYGY